MILATIVLLYGVYLVWNASFAPTDDYTYVSTLQRGHWYPLWTSKNPFYDPFRLGRFSPLVGQEHNLVAFVSRTPTAYYAFHAIQLAIVALCFVPVLRVAAGEPFASLAFVLLLFTPGFVMAWMHLQFGERTVAMCTSIMLWSMILLHEPTQTVTVIAVVSVSVFYKEPAFAAFGAFALFRLVTGIGTRTDIAVLGIATFYFALYAILVVPKSFLRKTSWTYTSSIFPKDILFFAKNIANYAFFSDPIVMLIGVPLIISRLYAIFILHHPAHPLFDPMLLAGSAYATIPILLGLYAPKFLLPATVWILPPVGYFLLAHGEIFQPTWLLLVGIAMIVFIGNTLPAGIYWFLWYKYRAINFQETVGVVAQYIRKSSPRQCRVLLDGIERAQDCAEFAVWGEFIKDQGVYPFHFDMDSLISPKRIQGHQIQRPWLVRYGAYQREAAPVPEPGDLLICSPETRRPCTRKYLDGLKTEWQLVYKTHAPVIPMWTLKSIIKAWFLRNTNNRRFISSTVNNISPNYLVWVKQ